MELELILFVIHFFSSPCSFMNKIKVNHFISTGETEKTELKYLEKEHLKQFEVSLPLLITLPKTQKTCFTLQIATQLKGYATRMRK